MVLATSFPVPGRPTGMFVSSRPQSARRNQKQPNAWQIMETSEPLHHGRNSHNQSFAATRLTVVRIVAANVRFIPQCVHESGGRPVHRTFSEFRSTPIHRSNLYLRRFRCRHRVRARIRPASADSRSKRRRFWFVEACRPFQRAVKLDCFNGSEETRLASRAAIQTGFRPFRLDCALYPGGVST